MVEYEKGDIIMSNAKNKDTCFVITPIGKPNEAIRRHVDGIIDAAIIPSLCDKYEIVVAHRMWEPGTITKQIISEIYNAKLVIANVTNLNPNVMYELALRHSIGKPVITIAENGTVLPFDISVERTIYYDNDAQGTLDLKASLIKTESEIDYDKTSGPIVEALGDISRDTQIIEKASENSHDTIEPLKYILHKLDRIESAIKTSNDRRHQINNITDFAPYRQILKFKYEGLSHQTSPKSIMNRLSLINNIIEGFIEVDDIHIDGNNNIISVYLLISDTIHMPEVYQHCYKILSECGFKNVSTIL